MLLTMMRRARARAARSWQHHGLLTLVAGQVCQPDDLGQPRFGRGYFEVTLPPGRGRDSACLAFLEEPHALMMRQRGDETPIRRLGGRYWAALLAA